MSKQRDTREDVVILLPEEVQALLVLIQSGIHTIESDAVLERLRALVS